MEGVVEQEVEVLAGSRFWLFALLVALAVAGPAGGRGSEVTPTAECGDEQRRAADPAQGESLCSAVQIGLSASPNPVAPGGTVSFAASSYPATDCWDNLDHSWWGNYSFTRPVSSSFTWTVYCMGNGVESGSLTIAVEGGGGGGGGGGSIPAVITSPAVSGSPEVGTTLTANRGSWTNSPTSYTYVWRRSGDLAELGRGSSLALTSAHVGYQLRADVQACNGTGCGAWASSAWTEAVTEPLPEYDPAYAEGSDSDEFFYESICTGRDCSMYLVHGQQGSALTASTSCARVEALLTRSNAVTKLWRMRHRLSFCVDGSRIKRVWDRLVDGEILVPGWARSIYPWEWTLLTDSPPAVGVSSSRSFGRLRFRMCGVFRQIGPLCQMAEPWIEVTLYGDGRATCNSSTGRIRNCKVRL